MIAPPGNMRGYFGIGVERMSKPRNMGAVMRTAHAFGASFFFSLGSAIDPFKARSSDTADSSHTLPTYHYDDATGLCLPQHCVLIGIELTDDAIELPSFFHPPAAAYVLGPEWGSLSPETLSRCQRVVKIPTRFCVNVSVAGAVVMYDRMLSTGRFRERALSMQNEAKPRPPHVQGDRMIRKEAGDEKSRD